MSPKLSSLVSPIHASTLLAGALLVLALHHSPAADWTEWRGPQRADRSPDTGLLKAWPADGPKRVWLNEDVGLGYSGYSIVGDRVYTMGLRGDQEFLIALDAKTGKSVWETPAGAKYPNGWGDGPRATPTIDGAFVFAMGGQGTLICAQIADGKKVWEKSMTTDLGGKLQNWGYTESVLISGDLVLCTPGGSQGTMAALKKSSGEVAWRSTDLTDAAQYSSPILVQHAGKPQVIQLVEKRFFGVDPSNGKVLWKQDFPGRVAVIPTPIYRDGQVYITAGYGAGCASVKIGTDQSVSEVFVNKVMKNHHGGVVLVGNHLYGHSDQVGWVCQDFKTGAEVWANKSLGKGAIHYADGMLYCLDENSGEVALVEASPSAWTEKGRFKLAPLTTKRARDGRIWTHPVVVNGRLYLRDQELLFCFDVKG
jgi:outer membrane protein assembly factor BamB